MSTSESLELQAVSAVGAWLEEEGAAGIPINGSLSIGRGAVNSLVLRSDGVSRCHAVIHAQGNDEFWLIDLGSRNGTWLNDHRINHPSRLGDGDRISILEHRFVFRQKGHAKEAAQTGIWATLVQQATRERPFWLLISDIENFTGLSQKLSGQELADQVSAWLQLCQVAVESNGGRINKYLGDGFFAVWPDTEGSENQIIAAVNGLSGISAKGEPTFRMVIHRGVVSVGGSPLLGEESFIGSEVNFTFRMEKLSGSLHISPLYSEAANAKLSKLVSLKELPEQRLKGFDNEYKFYAPEASIPAS